MRSLKFTKKYAPIPLVLFFCIAFFGFAGSGFPEDTAKSQQETDAEEVDWSEDLDVKIDKTIKVLKVLKKEVRDIEKSEKAKAKQRAAVEEASWSDAVRDKLHRAIRIWKKTREAIKEETKGAQKEPEWAQDLSGKLDKTIDTMTVIKEELDNIQED